ncbi:hypothetical protein DFR72_111231 [Lentzea flaviverrucosa]|uniref:Uncharacterized protein n=1 Tax=Lentzea flaviverrucosa TaxID=200379 RepID=A0A1H9WU54_9PSEU|nr:hypothetical protein DFR72_111231 [Lentzea flaviverrucosa]SES37364.1 hypothetical protein SAMN05216195_112225 [Lentzea flaviverrucosa]
MRLSTTDSSSSKPSALWSRTVTERDSVTKTSAGCVQLKPRTHLNTPIGGRDVDCRQFSCETAFYRMSPKAVTT